MQYNRILLSALTFLVVSGSTAIPKPEEGQRKERVIDKNLSEEEHYEEGGEHNADYDHEAFLGEEAKTFDQLTPEESKERLGKIVDKIDKDTDGFITQEELKAWIQYTQKRYIVDDAERQWQAHNPENKEKVSWEEYRKLVYGFMDDPEATESESEDGQGLSYEGMVKRDERRWAVADKDGDEYLNKTEFVNFLHPEDAPHMRDIVVLETIEDIDKDKDGRISLQEYIGDMYRGTEGEEEPDWVKTEREQFSQFRDKNNDGYMDSDEVKNWIIPQDYDHSEAEAHHLVSESDTDNDKQLTKEEVLDKYDLFVGSQATDYGEALVRHDEF